MKRMKELSTRLTRVAACLGLGLLFLGGFTGAAHAADYLTLPVVKPVVACDQLTAADIHAPGTSVTTIAAAETDTPKGKFCKITGVIAPAVHFEVDLPMEHWTQRFAQGGCGAYCGNVRIGLSNTGSCLPALNGELALAADDMGHQGGMGAPGGDSVFGADPDKRIDFAYRANHETALVAKALIAKFYGQPQKYAYFVGCSDGGREALAEGERYPNDFDGISAGAPVSIINVHNSLFHGWENAVDKRADGSPIMLRSKLTVLHAAVVAHCPTLSGVADGLLEDPLACKFDPAWVKCAADATDTSTCLNAEEIGVVEKLYAGPNDGAGHFFEPTGYPMGSEMAWNLPNSATTTQGGPGGGMSTSSVKYLLLPTVTTDEVAAQMAYTMEWFNKVSVLAPLWDAANVNLKPFEDHGGKLIVWHGLADTSVEPSTSVAFYQAVQKFLGEKATDSFMRLFLLPGVGHCGGGGFQQIDVLTPLMAWTEKHEAPKMLIAGKTAAQAMGFGGPGGPGGGAGGPGGGAGGPGGPGGPGGAGPGGAGPGGPGGAGPGGPGGPGGAGPGGPGGAAQGPGGPGGAGMGGGRPSNPYSTPDVATLATRPVYPYPYVALYTGTGDSSDAANFKPVKSPAIVPLQLQPPATTLFAPNNQKFYHAENGQVVADAPK